MVGQRGEVSERDLKPYCNFGLHYETNNTISLMLVLLHCLGKIFALFQRHGACIVKGSFKWRPDWERIILSVSNIKLQNAHSSINQTATKISSEKNAYVKKMEHIFIVSYNQIKQC